MITLQDYIKQTGQTELAVLLRTSRQRIHTWAILKSPPKIEMAFKLIAVSKGKLDFDSIYMPFLKKKFKGKKFLVGEDKKQLSFKF